MSIQDQIQELVESAPELLLSENKNRVIRIFWSEDRDMNAESILRAIRKVKADKKNIEILKKLDKLDKVGYNKNKKKRR